MTRPTAKANRRPPTRSSRPGDPLTPAQAEILRFLVEYFAEHAGMPTLREVAEGLGMSGGPTGPVSGLRALEKKGFVVLPVPTGRTGGARARSIEVAGLAEAVGPAARAFLAGLEFEVRAPARRGRAGRGRDGGKRG